MIAREMKYEYVLRTWGGFFHYKNLHGESDGTDWFDSKEDRKKEIYRLAALADQYRKDGHLLSTLAYAEDEGYLTRYNVVIKSWVEHGGKCFIVENVLGRGFGLSPEDLENKTATDFAYMMEWKWGISCPFEEDDCKRLFTTIELRE